MTNYLLQFHWYYPILIFGSVMLAVMVPLIHDNYILQQEAYASMYEYNIEHRTCESMKERIDSYNKFWVLNPSDALKNAYRDKCEV